MGRAKAFPELAEGVRLVMQIAHLPPVTKIKVWTPELLGLRTHFVVHRHAHRAVQLPRPKLLHEGLGLLHRPDALLGPTRVVAEGLGERVEPLFVALTPPTSWSTPSSIASTSLCPFLTSRQ